MTANNAMSTADAVNALGTEQIDLFKKTGDASFFLKMLVQQLAETFLKMQASETF